MRRILAILLACIWFSTPILPQERTEAVVQFIWDGTFAGEGRNTIIRYGNWYGPGWWGGSEDPKRVGLLPPIDALDAIAQKHDFGYQVAEELGKGRPELESYYKAMADGIAVRDAMALPKDPALWSPPPNNIAQARVYRDRIAVGFKDLVQKWNALMAWKPTKRLDPTDPEELNRILDGLLTDKQYEARALGLVRDWNKMYMKWQAEKAEKMKGEKLKAANPRESGSAPAAASGAWVLERTEFSVEKVDAAFMQKYQPTESGGDGAGSAGSTSGNPPRSWRMKIAWTPPPKTLFPDKEIDLKVTVSDAGSSDPNGKGFGSIGANCPSLGAVWPGPAAGFELNTGVRSKEASKTYTPLKATPGTLLYIIADYGVFARRQQFIYTYKFTLDPGNAPAPVSTSANQPVEATVFDSMNIYGVANQPMAPATITIQKPHVITSIMTYHWNNGRGTRAGTIALRGANGQSYGPWPVTGAPGQGGVPNASWTCIPNIEIPAGTYTIVDSEPVTWSQNPQSGGRGMALVKGYPAGR
jgi:hypothetical protein